MKAIHDVRVDHCGLEVHAQQLLPQPSQDNLRAVGAWLKVNGEAIYGAGPTPFGEELGATDSGRTGRAGKPLFVAKKAWRCTTKPGKLYIHVFEWPSASLNLPDAKVRKAYLLADPRYKPLKISQSAGRLHVALPPKSAGEDASVVVLETR